MRRIEPKRELKHYESEGSAIRRIMNEKLVTHHDRGVDTPHYQATMKKQGKVKLRKSGDYDDHGTHTVYANPEDVQKYMAKGYKKVPFDESLWDNIHKKRARIKAGSGEKMRKKGEKGAPTPDQIQRAQEEHCCEDCEHMAEGLVIEDAMIMENGEKKNVKLNKPQRTPGGPKKFAVYVMNNQGNVVIVRFGDPNMSIKRDDPERRKAFRARHNCSQKKDKTTPGYWSCKFWSSKRVGDLA